VDKATTNTHYRDGGPTIFAVVKHGKGVDNIVDLIISAWKASGAYDVCLAKWKSVGKKGSTA
jgi:urease accessory protein